MTFTESVRACLSKYVTFSGRAGRSEFWWFAAFFFGGAVVLSMIDAALFGTDPNAPEQVGILAPFFQLAMFLPYLAAAWRRMHDTGRPGRYLLLPLAVSIAMYVFLFLGIFAFGAMETAGADPDALRGPAAILGLSGLMVAGVVQFILLILLVYWLTRPSQPEANEYGSPV